MTETTTSSGNGVRITNKEIYDEVRAIREMLVQEIERRKSLGTQVKVMWTAYGILASIVAGAVVKVVAG